MTISKRKFFIGIVSSILISILHLLNAWSEYSGIIKEAYDTTSNLIYTISYSYFYISVLYLLKNLLVDYYEQEFLRKELNWLIRLNIIIAVLLIFIVLGFGKYLALILVILNLVNFVMYIWFFSGILSVDKSVIPSIGQLKNFAIAFLVIFLLVFVLSFVIEFGKKPELSFLNTVFKAIPFIFMSLFFYKTKMELYK